MVTFGDIKVGSPVYRIVDGEVEEGRCTYRDDESGYTGDCIHILVQFQDKDCYYDCFVNPYSIDLLNRTSNLFLNDVSHIPCIVYSDKQTILNSI